MDDIELTEEEAEDLGEALALGQSYGDLTLWDLAVGGIITWTQYAGAVAGAPRYLMETGLAAYTHTVDAGQMTAEEAIQASVRAAELAAETAQANAAEAAEVAKEGTKQLPEAAKAFGWGLGAAVVTSLATTAIGGVLVYKALPWLVGGKKAAAVQALLGGGR